MLGPFSTPHARQVLVAVALPTPSALDAASLLAVVVAPQIVASKMVAVLVVVVAAARQMLRELVVPRQMLRELAAARQMLRQLAVPRQMLREVAVHLAVHRLAAAAELLLAMARQLVAGEDVVTLHLVAGPLVLAFALLVAPGSLLAGQVAVMHSCM